MLFVIPREADFNPPPPSGKNQVIVNRIFKATRAVADLVNPLNKTESSVRDILIPSQMAKLIFQAGSEAGAKGLTVGNLSEISLRVGNSLEKFAINSAESQLGSLTGKDLCLVDIATGKVLGAIQPARHHKWHQMIYAETSAGCVLLCHAPFTMMCASRNITPEPSLWPDIENISDKLASVNNNDADVLSKLKSHQYLLVQGVGLLVTGATPKETLWSAEIIERFCQISISDHEGKNYAITNHSN